MAHSSFSLGKLAFCAASLLAAASTQATTLAFENFAQGYQMVTFNNTDPAAGGTYGAGELQFEKNDGGVVSLLTAYCVDIFQPATSSAQEYTLVDGITHFGAEKTLALSHLFSTYDAWNVDATTTAQETGALQMAVWEIVNEVTTVNGALQFDLSSGTFSATSSGAGTASLAQSWLDALPSANNWYQVSAYENANYQDFLVLKKLPEPGSVALMLGALGAMGLASRRRKARSN